MKKFIAFNVGVGDSFYLEINENTKILFDGGLKHNHFTSNFIRETGGSHIDIMVCSHGDADHVNGLSEFLKDPTTTCNQLWIPAGLTSNIKKLVFFPDEFYYDLINDLQNLEGEYSYLEDLEPYFQNNQEEPIYSENDKDMADEEIATSSFFEELRNHYFNHFEVKKSKYQQHVINIYNRLFFANHHLMSLSRQAFKTAESIRNLAISAFNKGVMIRLFEYSANGLSRGGEPFLLPVNSQEIYTIKAQKTPPLKFLYLSTINKESLVFYSPKEDDGAGVLFCSDSNFSFNQYKKSLIFLDTTYLITAPHHGSGNNKEVYEVLREYINFDAKTIFVRSDYNQYGSQSSRPCTDFLDIPKARRLCTNCRHPDKKGGQTIKLTSFNGEWVPEEKARLSWCYCVKY